MQNFPNNIVPTSLYCNKYYTRLSLIHISEPTRH